MPWSDKMDWSRVRGPRRGKLGLAVRTRLSESLSCSVERDRTDHSMRGRRVVVRVGVKWCRGEVQAESEVC